MGRRKYLPFINRFNQVSARIGHNRIPMGANNCGAARDDYGYLEKDISSEYHTYHTLKRRAVFLRRNTMDQVRCHRAGNYRVYTGAVPIAVRPDRGPNEYRACELGVLRRFWAADPGASAAARHRAPPVLGLRVAHVLALAVSVSISALSIRFLTNTPCLFPLPRSTGSNGPTWIPTRSRTS